MYMFTRMPLTCARCEACSSTDGKGEEAIGASGACRRAGAILKRAIRAGCWNVEKRVNERVNEYMNESINERMCMRACMHACVRCSDERTFAGAQAGNVREGADTTT